MTIAEFVADTISVDIEELRKYISSCPYRYKKFYIPKRNGNGTRLIAQPSKELKFLQNLVLNKYLTSLPVHYACKAYIKNSNIKDNALVHSNHSYLLKMDFKDFFSSITSSDLISHIDKHLNWAVSPDDKLTIEKIFFYYKERDSTLRLSIGAPTSPFISNTIMYEFDCNVSQWCKDTKISYTRYADDISFSTNSRNKLYELPQIIEGILDKNAYPSVRINATKTKFLSRKGNMHVTGLVLANDGNVSLGRHKKRYIRSLIYKYMTNNIQKKELNYLSGYLAFCISVEPDFVSRLRDKYGNQIIDNLYGIKKLSEE